MDSSLEVPLNTLSRYPRRDSHKILDNELHTATESLLQNRRVAGLNPGKVIGKSIHKEKYFTKQPTLKSIKY